MSRCSNEDPSEPSLSEYWSSPSPMLAEGARAPGPR